MSDVGVELKTDDAPSGCLSQIEKEGPENVEIVPEGQKGCKEGNLVTMGCRIPGPLFRLGMVFEFLPEQHGKVRIILIGPRCKDRVGGDLFVTQMSEPSQPERIVVAEFAFALFDHPVIDIALDLSLGLFQKGGEQVLLNVQTRFDSGGRFGAHAVSFLDPLHLGKPFLHDGGGNRNLTLHASRGSPIHPGRSR